MAGDGDGEGETTEYESDPEESKMSLKMRRREASDDEEMVEEREGEREDEVLHPNPRAGIADSEAESDGQGGAAEYDEEYEEDEEEYYDEQEEEEMIEGHGAGAGAGAGEYEEREIGGAEAEDKVKSGEEMVDISEAVGEGEEKKENEPFAVPTSGAFYMHDDRFQDNAGGRHRRTFGGRRLWESKDDRKWGHDKYEEMSVQDRHYEEGRRSSKGNFRGRGRARGAERGYARGGRMRAYGGNNNQNVVPKDVKGRGPRRYQPSKSEILPLQNKQSAKLHNKSSYAGSVRISTSTTNTNAEHESVGAKKVASNLNSASPPFYPAVTSNKDLIMTQKKETQAGNHNKSIRPSVVDNIFPTPHLASSWRGKNVIGSAGIEKLNINDSVSPAGARPLNNVHLPSSASSPSSANQLPLSRGDCRGSVLSGSAVFQYPQPLVNKQVEKASTPATQVLQRNPVQNRQQGSLHPQVNMLGQQPVGVSQGSSPPKTGKGTVQGAGRGSLVYGGAQVIGSGGNVAAGHGDQNLPAFLPVMQFGGQQPGGIGVPAVGMAFPGYVAQPNGAANPEMTWLPVLASAAGAMGAAYCPPYVAVDGSYHPRPTGPASALPAMSKDNTAGKPNTESKPHQRSEVPIHEFSQRQNKPRRYSEMSFSQ